MHSTVNMRTERPSETNIFSECDIISHCYRILTSEEARDEVDEVYYALQIKMNRTHEIGSSREQAIEAPTLQQ